ncbi:hypothetical protein CPC08DRAFT_770245 [Agrocybe pediades]|nr:hypothetical protein CPC08DRAFT_770245 [Agrocybe pediades]
MPSKSYEIRSNVKRVDNDEAKPNCWKQIGHQFSIDDALIEHFSTLVPKCRDEERKTSSTSFWDRTSSQGCLSRLRRWTIDQVVIGIRSILEKHSGQMNRLVKAANAQCHDQGVFLVLDKNVQELPWESMPIHRKRSVSRIPGI